MKCPNGLNKTVLVSFPRSGHHLLVRGLTEAANHRIVYSEMYNSAHNMNNCDFVNLQKSHDFDLTDPIDPELNYIVLIRGFELAVESWFRESEANDLELFRQSKTEYFDGFMAKWVNDHSVTNRIVISYHDMVDAKMNTVVKAAHSMGFVPDIDKLRRWEHSEKVKYTNYAIPTAANIY